MKKDYKYTVLFMMAVTAVFTLLLATAYGIFTPMIKNNQILAERKAILYSFNLPNSGSKEEINKLFEDKISKETKDGVEIYNYKENGVIKGTAIPFEGSALWGKVKGYMAVDESFKKVLGITFTDQNETPGLGGRIDEEPFKAQFRGLELPEGEMAYGKIGDKNVDAISGATLTSSSVMKIFNSLKNNVIRKWGGN